MALSPLDTTSNEMPINHIEIFVHSDDIEEMPSQDIEENNIEYSQRAQWLRKAMLGGKHGLVSVTFVMMGVEALNENITTMLLSGFAGLVAGACSMPIEESASVDTQIDTEVAQMKVHRNKHKVEEDDKLLNPFQASIASAFWIFYWCYVATTLNVITIQITLAVFSSFFLNFDNIISSVVRLYKSTGELSRRQNDDRFCKCLL